MARKRFIPVTIANGESVPAAGEDIGSEVVVGIEIPTSWTTAAISFLASIAIDGTYHPVYDELGVEVTIPSFATGLRYYTLPPTLLAGVQYLKVRSGIHGAAVTQSGDITLRLITMAL